MVSAKGLNWQKPETVNLLQMLYVTFEMGITYGELGNFNALVCYLSRRNNCSDRLSFIIPLFRLVLTKDFK